ncbi:hypothetical protein KFK09_018090 [Dendrobium nobile]|uniref:Uncharacterized protein n=1 Tax=Dendrobium nobile TaxID=94219 RepID=A0A8T3AVZ5_DENNO|nr:hypothetical protein KFK09_018090 [Dendrobium nobile]
MVLLFSNRCKEALIYCAEHRVHKVGLDFSLFPPFFLGRRMEKVANCTAYVMYETICASSLCELVRIVVRFFSLKFWKSVALCIFTYIYISYFPDQNFSIFLLSLIC